MFTGIVEEMGTVLGVEPRADGARLEIAAEQVLDDATLGASIAVGGCCLTVVALDGGRWAADAVTETLHRTTLGSLRPGDRVNLERPLRLADRLGGHLVQGHVDGLAMVEGIERLPDGSAYVRLRPQADLMRYVVEKGSVTLDGVSLTVADVAAETFRVALIPHTLAVTTLGALAVGSHVNFEADAIAKHVERLLAGYTNRPMPDVAPEPPPTTEE